MAAMLCIPAIAAPATPSDANRGTPSDALPPHDGIYDDVILPDDDMSLLADQDIIVGAGVHYDSGGRVGDIEGEFVSISGNYNRYKWPTLPEGQHYAYIYYIIPKNKLPRPGTYGITASFYEANIGISPTRTTINVFSGAQNVEEELHGTGVQLIHEGTKFGASGNIVIDYSTTKVSVLVHWPEHLRNLDILVPFKGAYQFTYSKQPGDTATGVTDPSNSGSANDIVADNTGQLVEQQEETNGLLFRIIETISNQLTAFWNQLAGEFTNLFTKMDNQHQENLDSMQNQTDELVNNQDQNTDKITGGYDSSGLDGTNQDLNDSMNDFAAQEDQIIDQISKPLDEFEFKDPLTQYLDTFRLLGNFMQDLFTGSGGFKDVINLSFLMGIALMVAGLYRFKGGN